ncbi:hypothetical protein AB4Y40_24755 [Paraburkholderia sp. EG287B]|uniref:hypothetical protein n=1 Tax=unclassified Paraburkholderia TaxID=2615204 RepID=UPI0034D2B45F
MSQRRPTRSRILGQLLLPVLLSSTLMLQGCATTAENIALGFGIGSVGTISALGCLLACQMNDARW